MALDRIHEVPAGRSPELEAAAAESAEILSDIESLPLYAVGVYSSKTKISNELTSENGTYWERTVIMDDGSKHHEYIGISNSQDAEELVVSVPAWWTSPRRGFNKETADKFLAKGKHVLVKGITENALTPLSRGAYDLHASLDYHTDDFGYNFGTRSISVHGDSNGAMQGTGILDYAPQFGRNIDRAYLVDPCLVHQPGVADIMKVARHPSYIPKEIVCLARQAIRMLTDPEERAINHLGTIDPSVGYFVGNLLLAKSLFSGEFGLLARHIPEGQSAHYLMFDHSLANHKRELETIINHRNHKTISYEIRSGTHMSIANPRTVRDKIKYMTSELPQSQPKLQLVTA